VLAARRLDIPLITGAETRVLPLSAVVPVDAASRVADLGLAEEARLLARPPSGHDGIADLYALRVNANPNDWIRWTSEHRSALGRVPSTPDAARAFQLVIPQFYGPTVRASAEANAVPPQLVWAVMRKESDFRSDALSGSDAMGLMQVIPQTALAIADRRGVAYLDGMLFEPHHAIEFGAWYLGALFQHFDEQLPLMIVAYNAGPLVVEDWLTRNAGMPYDEFVEEIPFDQARDYVRRVTEYAVSYIVGSGSEEVLRSSTLGGLIPIRIDGETHGIIDF
jgi:soluble lytic murein transglycosylase-like protein